MLARVALYFSRVEGDRSERLVVFQERKDYDALVVGSLGTKKSQVESGVGVVHSALSLNNPARYSRADRKPPLLKFFGVAAHRVHTFELGPVRIEKRYCAGRKRNQL